MILTHNIPKTLVIGAKGFVGKHFYDFYRAIYPETIGTHHVSSPGFFHLDLKDFSLDFLEPQKYQYAILACGIANPKRCEEEPEKSHFINVEQTMALAKALLQKQIIPILFSTDYVFDGKKTSYREDSFLCPLNQYGKQKAELEKRARKELSHYCMIRCSKIYGTMKGDGSIFDQMAACFSKGQEVRAATDQILAPIHINEMIKHVIQIQQEKKFGLFNFAGQEIDSRYNYAKCLAKSFGKEYLVIPTLLEEVQDGVKRPNRVVLDSSFLFSSAFENILQLSRQYQIQT